MREPRQNSKAPAAKTFTKVLEEERTQIKARRKKVFVGAHSGQDTDQALNESLFGISFSGGGIRSATFNLGILQGLADQRMLTLADYLSTVSGGGYIGSWFHGVVSREPFKLPTGAHGETYADYQEYLAQEEKSPGTSGQDPISFLRKYSNYLSPELGLLSSDTWVIGTIWLRNTILNQMILFLAVAAALMAALVLGNGLILFEAGQYTILLYVTLALVLLLVVCRINLNLRRVVTRELGLFSKDKVTNSDTKAWWRIPDSDNSAWITIVLPLWLVSILFGLLLASKGFSLQNSAMRAWTLAALLVLFSVSIVYSGFWTCFALRHENNLPYWRLFRILLTAAIVLTCSVVTFVMFALEERLLFHLLRTGAGPWQFADCLQTTVLGEWLCVLLAPALTTLVLAFGVLLQTGLAGVDFAEGAREWYSRLAAKVFILSTGWLGWFAIAAFAPLGVSWMYAHYKGSLTSAILAWLGSTVAGVMSGKSPATVGTNSSGTPQGKGKSTTLELLAKYAPPIALLGMLIAVASASWWAVDSWLKHSPKLVQDLNLVPERWRPWSLTVTGNLWLLLIVAVLAVVAYLLSTRININEFSLNHFYKNRLVRCYLGASQGNLRKPNRFTGFDPEDDIRLSTLLPNNEKPYLGPFPILNCALNLNHGKELAWQERRASSFVFTPSFCGYVPANKPQDPAEDVRTNQMAESAGYVETSKFVEPNGPRIGMAMAISGAAVNPSMGYHTQASTAFLMTIFNVRLGWWVGNTRFPDAAATPGPRVALRYLVSELLGFTDEDSKYANLSDGGHFENLGLYELARRKCRFIIVGDGEQDENYQFESLGGAIRKIRIDFGYSIKISPKRIFLEDDVSQVHCALGTIDYNDGPDKCGVILYLKASLTGDESYDVLQHKKADPNFPHDTTANQFFTESMFESYRKLGRHVVKKVFNRIDPPASPADLKATFRELQQNWLPPVTAAAGSFTKHAERYSRLLQRLSTGVGVRFLDREIFPNFPPEDPKFTDNPDPGAGSLLVTDFIQLMEDVYLDLNLEDEEQLEHQQYTGWVKLFAYWTKQPTFQKVWSFAGKTYGAAFQRFYERMKAR